MESIILFGGSFDPIHNGHLRMAKAASLRLNADVVFIPARAPRWKKTEADSEDRLAMLKIALQEEGSPSFSYDLVEMEREGDISYTIDTVLYFHDKYPNRKLYWLLGADEVNKFSLWKEAEKIAALCQIVYIPRPELQVNEEAVASYHMIPLDYTGSGTVSSSAVRNLESIDVPHGVLTYIEEHRLYFMAKLETYLTGHRLEHSLSVAHLAYDIALKNQVLTPEKAYIAGLLHDLGKHLSEEESTKILKENYPECLDYPQWCWHQWTGAYLAETAFGIKDEAILDAITYHCTGKTHMPPLTKIIYSADKIDPSRGYDSSKLIKACFNNYYVGFLTVLKENQKFLQEQGELETTPLSEACYNLYIGERK